MCPPGPPRIKRRLPFHIVDPIPLSAMRAGRVDDVVREAARTQEVEVVKEGEVPLDHWHC